MRSRKDYNLTKDEVHGYAHLGLEAGRRLEYEGIYVRNQVAAYQRYKGPCPFGEHAFCSPGS